MGIFDRLGSVINSYFNDFGDKTNRQFGSSEGNFTGSSGDPDVDAAYEELNDFLRGSGARQERQESSRSSSANSGYSASNRASPNSGLPPEELRDDFEKLGVPFGADEETCKAAYKKLIKIHHPDRHAGHEANFKKATERSARINASWDRIDKWRQSIK